MMKRKNYNGQWVNAIVMFSLLVFMSSCLPDGQDQNLEGEWNCTETSEIFMKSLDDQKGTTIFPVYIAQDATYDNQYYIDNFYQLGTGIQVKIMVSGGNTIVLETQTVNGIEFSGSGTVNSSYNRINMVYTADDGGGQVDHVTAEYVR